MKAQNEVRVTAADFNGQTFDGCPFSATPEWLHRAVGSGEVAPHTRGCTDYAQWDVNTAAGTVSAEPGDHIQHSENGGLSVRKALAA